ncbi:RES family NAD+ phosphorylase [Pseudomonas sp. HR96]|uniref:RES family NAD+ phosphorylase n=1 Tax=Pseudomonas sp. HR96 TaxID=1027966 RepID=UPI002A76123B|nr:RES family NAD+ phosphorylase [Pseudomonas sp. HR96]WPP02110.1 RES family NAD+ phosphorylase [Pseudomonas sp. HR96]
MVAPAQLPSLGVHSLQAYRLVNSKFPPIALFDDVADASEFDTLFQIQALTNPRLLNEAGRLELIPRQQIPFGIPGCSYATAPFTHVNPAGSRFSDGSFGVLYLGESLETALAEVRHHQDHYWSGVAGLGYDRFVFRGLTCTFNEADMLDAAVLPLSHPVHAADDYSQARLLGQATRAAGRNGLRYRSVRRPGDLCWALLTPKVVTSIVQSAHYEMIWNQGITSVNQISQA